MQNSFEYLMFFCYAAGMVPRTGKAAMQRVKQRSCG